MAPAFFLRHLLHCLHHMLVNKQCTTGNFRRKLRENGSIRIALIVHENPQETLGVFILQF